MGNSNNISNYIKSDAVNEVVTEEVEDLLSSLYRHYLRRSEYIDKEAVISLLQLSNKEISETLFDIFVKKI